MELQDNKGLHTSGIAAVLDALADQKVKVRRLKAYSTGADDGTLQHFAAWMRRYEPADRPFEVHFSDCAVTDRGLRALVDVAAEGRRDGLWKALWLQVGRNHLTAEYVDELSADWRACFALDRSICGTHGCGRCYPLVHLHGAKDRQREPPAPEVSRPWLSGAWQPVQ